MSLPADKRDMPFVGAPKPINEKERLQSLYMLDLLDSDRDEDFDKIAALAKNIFNVPVALITLIDDDRQWFKSCYGVDVNETPREVAFCAYTILKDETLIVRDTALDDRFFNNPLVVGEPHIKFYAGAPIYCPKGHKIGTICVIDDRKTYPDFSEHDAGILEGLAHIISKLIIAKNERIKAVSHSDAKTEFLSHISHELRTPLNVVIGISNLLKAKEALDPQTTMMVRTMNIAAESLLELINSVLDLSAIEAKNFELMNERFSLDPLFEEISFIVGPKAVDKGIAFKIDNTSVKGCYYEGDRLRMKQALINLLGNAVKFTEKGTVTLNVTRHGGNIEMQIFDTGIGIPENKIKAIFDKFVQVHANDGRYQGTGLGLAITKELIQKMGGFINVESVLGLGTKFHVNLPDRIIEQASHINISMQSADKSDQGSAMNFKILLAEDYPANIIVTSYMLKEFGYHFDVAQSGREVLEKIDQETYGIILMDINMPYMDGIEATRKIREKGLSIPIIGMSAHVFEKERQKCFSAGMNDYVTKPIDYTLLNEKIKSLTEETPSNYARAQT